MSVYQKLFGRPKGTKKGYVEPATEVPGQGIFNPMDYIDVSDYKSNRRGMMQYEEDLAQIQYLADLRQQQFALDYQDPQSDVSRQRSAGLNPDFIGLSGVSAPAGPAGQGVDMSKYPTNLDQIQKGISIIDQVSSMTKDFLSGGLQLSGMFMQNIQSEASALSSLFSLQDQSAYRNVDINKLPISRRLKRKLEALPSSRTEYIQNTKGQGDLFDSSTSLMESKAKHWQHVLNPLFNPSGQYDHLSGLPQGSTVEQWTDVWKPLTNWAYKQFEHESFSSYAKSKSDEDYWSTLNSDGKTLGSVRGEREMASDTERGNQADFMNSIREPLQGVAKKLKKLSDDGNSWASFALIALYFVSSFSFSSSSSSGPYGDSSSRSFGFGR